MAAAFSACLLLAHPAAAAQDAPMVCAPVAIPGHYGPFDYVTERDRLEIVERFHFTPRVEALVSGESGFLGGDLTYTLNASPNHHRALAAIMKWGAQTNSDKPPYLMFSIDCYFDRAVRFRPQDVIVRALYGMYLAQAKRMPEALRQLEAASHFAEDNGLSHHNIGLTYFELGLFPQALSEAHLARKLGYEGQLLADKLKAAKQWKDPAA